jgi:enoyl-CoA hydratase/carnithine racemase
MLMTGEPIDAERARDWGLVTEIVSADGLMERAMQLASTIASRPPIAVETAKINVAAAAELGREQAIAYERDLQTICFATEDAREGRTAFAERRPGVFHRK